MIFLYVHQSAVDRPVSRQRSRHGTNGHSTRDIKNRTHNDSHKTSITRQISLFPWTNSYPVEETTPNRSPREVETVTIIDPRHALYGQKLRLVQFHGDGKARGTCTVETQKDIWRRIPVSVTDCSADKPEVFPLPLNLVVVRQLLDSLTKIAAMNEEESNHETRANHSRRRADLAGDPYPNDTKPAMGEARAPSPTANAALSHSGLPADPEDISGTVGGDA